MTITKSFPQKAMLLAAGLGERLRPLTLTTPKPLIPIQGRPLIEYNLILLKKFGVKEVHINLHHLGDQIEEKLKDGSEFGIKIFYSREKTILGTGGGLKAAQKFLEDQTFFLMNADVFIDLNLQDFFEFHQKQKSVASLVVIPSDRKDIDRWVFLNKQNQVIDISSQVLSGNFSKTVFSGVQILEPEIFKILPEEKKSCLILDGYLPLLKNGKKLSAYLFEGYWRDLGTLERYAQVKKEFEEKWPYTALKLEDFSLR